MDFHTLKARHRQERQSQPTALSVRIHRALSWLARAEQSDDKDGQFIFLWIAFNAAYALEIDEQHRLSEQENFRQFLEKLCGLDGKRRLEDLVWHSFTGPIRVLLDNPYVFESFWQFQRGQLSESDWQRRFDEGKKRAHGALAHRDTAGVLAVVFNRIYTLRNQLIHGGATWDGSVNRNQLRDCTAIMAKLVPLVIEIMMDNPRQLWGDACYPVV